MFNQIVVALALATSAAAFAPVANNHWARLSKLAASGGAGSVDVGDSAPDVVFKTRCVTNVFSC